MSIQPPRVPPPNLFTPDFGQAPHALAGRDAIVADLSEGLTAGPLDKRFTTLLLGPRGAGKTALLHHLRDATASTGWIVLPLDAGTPGLQNRLDTYIRQVQQPDRLAYAEAPGPTERRTTMKFKLLSFEWQRQAVRQTPMNQDMRLQLSILAEKAAENNSAVLLIVDEVHGVRRQEMRRLALDVQHVTKGERLPLALVGAGLSRLKHTLLADNKMTFFHRCHRVELPPIAAADVAGFYTTIMQDAGGSIEEDALDIMVASAADALPYKMQLVGDYAWRFSGAPTRPVDVAAAKRSVEAAEETFYQNVALPAWYELSHNEQEYLITLAELGGTAPQGFVAQNMPPVQGRIAHLGMRLVNYGCVLRDADGLVRFGHVLNSASMERILAEERDDPDGSGVANGANQQKCGAWMPRAKAACVLLHGHSGAHRSH
ncbi:ATP-binding protein [Candidatus Poriferisodalis sp.]|uniref:ATP-binding protein n=1 Tax=Candidatus Poriferisodalis sp. TaxID=3101277 RepID=UPI003B0214FD